MHSNRRNLLALSAGAGVSLPLHPLLHSPGTAAGSRTAVQRRRIPKTGELIPVIGLGSSITFDADPTDIPPALVQVMQGFLDCGGSVIDSSPMYRRAEAVIGGLLQKVHRQDLFYATKVWTPRTAPDQVLSRGKTEMQRSADRMGTKVMDLMQVHNLVNYREHLPVLREMKAAKKIRYLGITEMRKWDTVIKLMETADLDFIQIPYSLAERAVEQRVLPAAAATGTAVLVMRPFQRGRLFRAVRGKALPAWAKDIDCHSWAQVFLKWVLGHPAVTCPIPATSKPKHIYDNMGGGVGRTPDAGLRKRIAELF